MGEETCVTSLSLSIGSYTIYSNYGFSTLTRAASLLAELTLDVGAVREQEHRVEPEESGHRDLDGSPRR